MKNVTFSLGSVAIIDKVDDSFKFFDFLFNGLSGRAKGFKEFAKLFVYNRLTDCVSMSRLPEVYPSELFEQLGFAKKPSGRSLYRNMGRIGDKHSFFIE